MKVLLGVTGSVAATLTYKLIGKLQMAGHKVEVVATKWSLEFWNPAETERSILVQRGKLKSADFKVWQEADEWPAGGYVKDMPVRHIELREWADALLIAPLTANTLGKMANGIVDNLLTSVAYAWDRKRKPLIVAPAMNTLMWEHPATKYNLERIRAWHPHFAFVMPVAAKLACGDVGIGAMANIDDIVETMQSTAALAAAHVRIVEDLAAGREPAK